MVDEVFADYPLASSTPTWASPLARDSILTFSLGGLSKSVGLPQLKLGWIALSGPDRVVTQALDRLAFIADTYLSVSTPVQHALPGLLTAGAAVRAQIQQRIRTNYDALHDVFRAVPSSDVLPAEGGWYAVIQVPATRPEESWVLDLLEHDRVLVHPGFFFDFPREAYLIISLLPPEEIFAEAVSRLTRRLSQG
jgi:aspartate/methionine/tyrosine aminotransferase